MLSPDVIGLEIDAAALRPLARVAPRDAERGRPRGGGGDPRARARTEGGDDHAGDARRRRLAEPDPARGDRRQGDRPHRPAHSRRRAVRRRARADLGRAHGGRRRLRRQGMARGRGRFDEVAFRTERIERSVCRAVAEFAFREAERTGAKVFGGPKYTVSPTYEGMLKEEMDAAAERHPRRAVRAAADRRHVRAARRLDRRPARDPGAEPRRRHPLRPRPPALRLDRRLGVDARRVRGRRTSSRTR